MRAGRAVDPDPRPARQAAQRAQHLLHAAGAVHHDQQPLRLRLRRKAQLARAGRPDAGGRAGRASRSCCATRRWSSSGRCRGATRSPARFSSSRRSPARCRRRPRRRRRRRRRPSPRSRRSSRSAAATATTPRWRSKNVAPRLRREIRAHAQAVYQQAVVLEADADEQRDADDRRRARRAGPLVRGRRTGALTRH